MTDPTAQAFETAQIRSDAATSDANRIRPFVPRTRPAPSEVVPLSDQIKENALRFSTMVQNLQESERKAREELAHAMARADQLDARLTQLQSELNTANMQRDAERAERIRLMSVLANMGSMINDAMDGQP